MRKKLLGTATIAALFLGACSGEGPADDQGSSDSDLIGEGQELTVWIMEGTNPDSTEFFDKVSEEFKEQTGATLDVQMVPWASAKEKFATAIAGGTTPDVAEIGNTWTPEFADAGALVDIADRVNEAGLEGDLVDGLVDSATYEDGLYAMPWYAGVRAFVYNTEIFDDAGVVPPTNWAELEDAVETLNAHDDDITAFPIVGGSEFSLYPWIWGAGGDIAQLQGDQWVSTLDSPEAREGITFYTDLALEHESSLPAATTWDEADVLAAFEQGDIAMTIQGSWTPARIIEDAPELEGKLGSFTIPAKDGGIAPSFLGGSHLGIFEGTSNEDLAWEFVELMTTGEFAKEWSESANYFPGQASLLEEMSAEADDMTAAFIEQMVDGGASTPVAPQWGAIQGQQVTPTMLQSILAERESVDDAVASAVESMDKAFNE